jgi:hypothetical protein
MSIFIYNWGFINDPIQLNLEYSAVIVIDSSTIPEFINYPNLTSENADRYNYHYFNKNPW